MTTQNKSILLVIVLRLGGYVYMLFNPLYGFLLSIFLDWLDWFILVWGENERYFYHKLDKPLDYLLYIFFIPILINTDLFPLYVVTLIYRALGYIAYYITKKQKVFILFADFSQVLIILFFIRELYLPNLNILDPKLLAILFIFKMLEEIAHHGNNPGMTYPYILNFKASLQKKFKRL